MDWWGRVGRESVGMRGAKFGLMVMIVASLLGREVCGRCAVERGYIHTVSTVQYSVYVFQTDGHFFWSLVPPAQAKAARRIEA